MDKVEKQLMVLAADAAKAIKKLKAMQHDFMHGAITYYKMQERGKPLIKTFNLYAKELAKARKMPYKPITMGYFMR